VILLEAVAKEFETWVDTHMPAIPKK